MHPMPDTVVSDQDATATTPAPTLRHNMESVAEVLGLPLGPAADAGLAFRISDTVQATIAPGRNERLVALFRIAAADTVSPTLWISALSEAAGWGLLGERQRFVVVDGHFTLMWTTPALSEPELLNHLHDLFATAVALADVARRPGA
ncbi:hypothetical protein ACPOLB_24935 [Rubrivivax sp. RP6-9]|uniref:hypothetical protein n=1 Tax=Rubrivivax sp. RP6-9 TaxID=3415750 RepID=UPI003CC5B36B